MQPKIPNIKLPSKLAMQQPSGQQQVGMNPQAFDELIKGKGIRMTHARPVPCPRRKDRFAADHDPSCNECFNGFLYYGQRQFIGAFQANSSQRNAGQNGTFDVDQAQIVCPANYDDGTPMDVQFFDQIIIPDFTVRYFQLIEHSQTGIDKLHFPAKSLDFITDSQGIQYAPNVDVKVNDKGYLEWLPGGKRPGYDLAIRRGMVLSISYYTRPAFTVVQVPHQLRATQTIDANGNAVQARFPQLVVVRKDFIPHDPNDKVGPSDRPEPRDGQF